MKSNESTRQEGLEIKRGTDSSAIVVCGTVIFLVLMVLFCGDPDIHDGIIRWLSR